ncbi:hypothetical protein DVH26_10760 [Paenibacillus sp. H1-7]|uniref:hypothetical protein n=1 Tax=Paenibacillus sp. H1-7 TaxID=2282849 RepID=UPI001EF84688|nr:hypothetical protein [Paenibacillus sp. H1-7]ULL14881.1 hypothetical protein DVH26_10760 [Paenibacillus sp. H1-7]
MKFQIIWNAFFKVKNEEKADRLINQIEVRTGHPIVSKQFERSKKEPSLLGVTFVLLLLFVNGKNEDLLKPFNRK